jgi:hypothetical protein
MTSPDEKRFYSVEYVDEEGELNIKHVFMTHDESLELLEMFRSHGVTASINQLSHNNQSSPELPAVHSVDELLGRNN